MSDPTVPAPRPVSLAAIGVILLGFALFLAPAYWVYVKHRPARLFIPESAPAEKLSSDQAWQATADSRLAYLRDLRERQEKQLGSYAWVDQKAGVVQLPIDQAMKLVAQQYGSQQP